MIRVLVADDQALVRGGFVVRARIPYEQSEVRAA